MTIKDIAKRIPDDVRSELLMGDDDIILNAISVKDNPNMKTLLRIWYDFIEPSSQATDCPICIGNILTSFKQMESALIELENEYQKLKAL